MIDRRLQVRFTRVENPDGNPFDMCPLRELARRTEQDPANLSKYKTGKLVMSETLYWRLMDAADKWYDEQVAKFPAREEAK